MIYSSIENKKIKEIRKLNSKKYRDKTNLFLVEGEHLVQEAYKKGYLKELLLEENTTFSLPVPTNYLTLPVLKSITSLETPPKIIGLCSRIQPNEKLGNHILILDKIQDPGNLGTIIRSAVAFHVDTIFLSLDSVDVYNPKVVRATQGLLFSISIIYCDLKEVISSLKKQGYPILGTSVNGGKSLKTIEKMNKFAIIMGNEGNGVEHVLLNESDELLYIDMNADCESLNVAVATSIILYELDK